MAKFAASSSISFFAVIFIIVFISNSAWTVESMANGRAWSTEKPTVVTETKEGTTTTLTAKSTGETVVQPEKLCEKASLTFSGTCRNTQSCDKQCISWESAAHGACHTRGGKKMCFCYFNC